jgi:hypothetical protein
VALDLSRFHAVDWDFADDPDSNLCTANARTTWGRIQSG